MPRTGIVALMLVLALPFPNVSPADQAVWVSGFREAESMLEPRAGAALAQAGDFVFMIGGVDGRQFLASVEFSRIMPDGALSPWRGTTPLPAPRGFMAAVAHNGAIYLAGGGSGGHGETLYRSVLRAQVREDGSLGPWESQSELRLPRRCVKLFVRDNALHAVGGFGGALLDSVESAQIRPDGSLGPWILLPAPLTRTRYVSETRLVGDFVVTAGGHDAEGGRGLPSVEIARPSDSGLTWRTTRPMQVGRYAFGSFALGDTLYVLGGISGTEYLASIENTQVTKEGELGEWKMLSTALPAPVAEFATLIKDKWLFVLGGSTRAGYRRGVWMAELGLVNGVGYWGRAGEAAQAPALAADAAVRNEGVVRLTLDAVGYTYVLVKGRGGDIWLAMPTVKLAANTRISYGQGVFMSNFYSKALRRTFAGITFVSGVQALE